MDLFKASLRKNKSKDFWIAVTYGGGDDGALLFKRFPCKKTGGCSALVKKTQPNLHNIA